MRLDQKQEIPKIHLTHQYTQFTCLVCLICRFEKHATTHFAQLANESCNYAVSEKLPDGSYLIYRWKGFTDGKTRTSDEMMACGRKVTYCPTKKIWI